MEDSMKTAKAIVFVLAGLTCLPLAVAETALKPVAKRGRKAKKKGKKRKFFF